MMKNEIFSLVSNGKFKLNAPLSGHRGGKIPRQYFILGTPNTIRANISVQSINDFKTASLNLEIYENGKCYWTFNNGASIQKGEGEFQEIRDNKIILSRGLVLEFKSSGMAKRALKRFKLTM